MSEIWRPILEAPGYEVSNHGRVRSWLPLRNGAPKPSSPHILRGSVDKDGYRRVILRARGASIYRRVAALVATAWHGPRPIGCLVRHLDGSKDNDMSANLKWGTPKENCADMLLHGTRIRGHATNTSKLTEAQVKVILVSEKGHSELAREFGVTPSAIWHIRNERSWAHVGD